MEFIFTDHAKKRMRERSVSEATVKSAIDKPDILQETILNRKIAIKLLEEKRLEVVYVKEGHKIIVITTYEN